MVDTNEIEESELDTDTTAEDATPPTAIDRLSRRFHLLRVRLLDACRKDDPRFKALNERVDQAMALQAGQMSNMDGDRIDPTVEIEAEMPDPIKIKLSGDIELEMSKEKQ